MDALAKLIIIEDIRQLKARYFRCMDLRDWDGMAEVFSREFVFDCTEGLQVRPLGGELTGPEGAVIRGREAIMEVVKLTLADRTSVHHGHGHEITVESTTEAHGVIAMQDFIYAADRRTPIMMGAGHYEERYVVEDGAWRIAFARLTRLIYDDFAGEAVGTGR